MPCYFSKLLHCFQFNELHCQYSMNYFHNYKISAVISLIPRALSTYYYISLHLFVCLFVSFYSETSECKCFHLFFSNSSSHFSFSPLLLGFLPNILPKHLLWRSPVPFPLPSDCSLLVFIMCLSYLHSSIFPLFLGAGGCVSSCLSASLTCPLSSIYIHCGPRAVSS